MVPYFSGMRVINTVREVDPYFVATNAAKSSDKCAPHSAVHSR
jgi:hypothetical protein